MDQLISNLLAILPKSTTTTTPTLQRYATIFGRFLERLHVLDNLVSERRLIVNTIEDCRNALKEYEHRVQDLQLVQLRGILLCMAYLRIIRPTIDQSTECLTSAIIRLCQYRTPTNLLAFYECLVAFDPREIVILLPNYIHKLLKATLVLSIITAIKIVKCRGDELEAEHFLTDLLVLVRHRDLGIRRAAWSLLRLIDERLFSSQDQIITIVLEETHLEVLEMSLGVSICAKDDRCKEKWQALMDYLIREKVANLHPILFRRLLDLDFICLKEVQLDISAINLLELARKTRCFQRFLAEEKALCIQKFLLDELDYNTIYAGLAILEECVLELGVKVSLLQPQLTKILDTSDDEQLRGKCLLILLKLANASNWKKLVQLAFRQFPVRKCMQLSEHLLKMKVLRRVARILKEFCTIDELEVFLKQLMISISERATSHEIKQVFTDWNNEIPFDRLWSPCTSRVLLLMETGHNSNDDKDPELHERWILLQGEFGHRRYDRFEESIFVTRQELPGREIVDIKSPEKEVSVIPADELLSEVFLGFADLPPRP